MKTYIGTKLINAKPMTRQAYNDFRGWQLPADEDGDDAGYLVEYHDGGQANTSTYKGYVSWSPEAVFDGSYRPITSLSYGMALEALKLGQKVARAGWNGKGMFVYLVPAVSYPAQTGAAKEYFGEDAMVPYAAYFAIKGVDGVINTWVPSISDNLAEDWEIVP